MQRCDNDCKWYVAILMVPRIKHENRGTWPPYYTSIFFKDQINKCRNYKPDKQWGSVNVSWGHRTSGTTMAKVPWLGESLAATSTTCLAGLQRSLSRFFGGRDKILYRLRATFLQLDISTPITYNNQHFHYLDTAMWMDSRCFASHRVRQHISPQKCCVCRPFLSFVVNEYSNSVTNSLTK